MSNIEIGSIDRIEDVLVAMRSVRQRAQEARDQDDKILFDELRKDLLSLEHVLVMETELYIGRLKRAA